MKIKVDRDVTKVNKKNEPASPIVQKGLDQWFPIKPLSFTYCARSISE